MTTDPQKTALYAAERRFDRWLDSDDSIRVFGSTWVPEPEIRFGDIPSVQRYVDKVLAHIGWAAPCSVRARRGQTRGHYEPRNATIALPVQRAGRFTLRETYVLHELAHHLTPFAESHGPDFATATVHLHDALGYPVRARLLAIAYAEAGVKTSDKTFR